MLKAIRDFFDTRLKTADEAGAAMPQSKIQLATAALLIEVARSDFEASENEEAETSTILDILRSLFSLEEENLTTLLSLAETEARQATDFYQFTQLVNSEYDYQDKVLLIENLWRVAFADGRTDRYEEHFVRKVSGLLHLAHSDFIQAKIRARNG